MQKNKFSIYFSLFLLFSLSNLVSCKAAAGSKTDTIPPEQGIRLHEDNPGFPVLDDIRAEALRTIMPVYTDWQTAEVSGKLRMKKLPLSPTIKIFMKKNEEISISVRASLLGEVGRIEVAGDSIIAINKMKRVYCAESISAIKYDYPGIIADIQSLLLGRAVVLRAGELSPFNADFLDFTKLGDDNADTVPGSGRWSLSFPKGRTGADEFGYEYHINADGLTERLKADLSTSDNELSLALDYTYPGNGFDLNISLDKDLSRIFEASVDFGPVKWEAAAPAPVNLGSRYTRLGIKQFLKSF